MPHTSVVNRLRAEFLEMPGLRLTCPQAQRLCGVERTPCQGALDALVDSRFLCLKPDGVYARLTDGAEALRRHAVKADLRDEDRSPRNMTVAQTPKRAMGVG